MSLFAAILTACAVRHQPALADGGWPDPALYPFEAHWLDVDGGRMHYVDEGEGPVVVLVHGTPSWSFEWRALVRDLARDHRVIAPDHVGFGLSEKPEDWAYTPAAHAANLGRLLDHLAVGDVTLVVHDLGGPIGLGWALDHPDRVARVVVMNTSMWRFEADAERFSRVVAGPIGKYLYLQRNFSPRRIVPMAMAVKPSPDVHRHYYEAFPTPETRMGPWRIGCELAGSAAWFDGLWARRAALADKPALIVWGMADPAFKPHLLSRWQELWPSAPVVKLDGVGHFPQEEAPDRVSSEIGAWLRGE
ncbi:MAG: alpha/beta fold hydrolase [Myxococcota bacterium]